MLHCSVNYSFKYLVTLNVIQVSSQKLQYNRLAALIFIHESTPPSETEMSNETSALPVLDQGDYLGICLSDDALSVDFHNTVP